VPDIRAPCSEVGVEEPPRSGTPSRANGEAWVCSLMTAGSGEGMVALVEGDDELEKVLRMADRSQGGFEGSVARVR